MAFDLDTADGSAIAGDDYQAVHERVVLNEGEHRSIRIPIRNRPGVQHARDFEVSITNVDPPYAEVQRSEVLITINDSVPSSERSEPEITANPVEVYETAGFARVFLRRNFALTETVSVEVATADRTARAGVDYEAVAETVTFDSRQFEIAVEIPILDLDDWWTGSRELVLEFHGSDRAALLPGPVAITIHDDDEPVTIIATAEEHIEREGEFLVSFTRSGGVTSSNVVRLEYVVEELEESITDVPRARAGRDFEPVSGTLEFGMNQSHLSVSIPIHNNSEVDGSRFFRLRHSGEGYRAGNSELLLVILDDEHPDLIRTVQAAEYGMTYVTSILTLSDGRRLIMGHNIDSEILGGGGVGDRRVILARAFPDGRLDESFGNSGRIIRRGFGGQVERIPGDQILVSYSQMIDDTEARVFFTLRGDELEELSNRLQYDQFANLPGGATALVVGNTVQRLMPDLSPDPVFNTWEHPSIVERSLFADGEGRIYLAVLDSESDGTQLFSIVRLDADGTRDLDYAPAHRLHAVKIAGISSEGELYWSYYSPDAQLFLFCATTPAGESRELGRYRSAIKQALALANDILVVENRECGWAYCRTRVEFHNLSSGAAGNPAHAVELGEGWMDLSVDPAGIWNASDAIQIVSGPGAAFARRIGFPQSHAIQFGSNLLVRLARSGATESAVSVEVRLREIGSDSATHTGELEMPKLSGESVVALPIPAGSVHPREFEVELVAVPGELEAFGTRQRILWFGPERTPGKLWLLRRKAAVIADSFLFFVEEDFETSGTYYRLDSGSDLERWAPMTSLGGVGTRLWNIFSDPRIPASYMRLVPQLR